MYILYISKFLDLSNVFLLPVNFENTALNKNYDPNFQTAEFKEVQYEKDEFFQSVFNKTPEEFASEHPDEFFINNK